MLALFGAPLSHEDDATRALLVALEMHRELARLCKNLPHQAELTLHCGVSAGHGIARVLGSEARMDYAVLGDSVILAQRLEAAAPKGETYVGDSTYRLTADRFELSRSVSSRSRGRARPRSRGGSSARRGPRKRRGLVPSSVARENSTPSPASSTARWKAEGAWWSSRASLASGSHV